MPDIPDRSLSTLDFKVLRHHQTHSLCFSACPVSTNCIRQFRPQHSLHLNLATILKLPRLHTSFHPLNSSLESNALLPSTIVRSKHSIKFKSQKLCSHSGEIHAVSVGSRKWHNEVIFSLSPSRNFLAGSGR